MVSQTPKTYYVSLKPIASTLRVYGTKDGYAKRKPFLVVGTVTHIDDSTVLLQALKGELCRESIVAIADELYQAGYNTAKIKRPPGKQMPFTTQLIHGAYEDTHIVDIYQMAADGLIKPRTDPATA